MKLFMDDNRVTPPGFDIRTYTAQETIDQLKSGKITEISLDHDLGDESLVGSGTIVANFLEEAAATQLINPVKISIHTANPVARQRMQVAAERAHAWWGIDEPVDIVSYDLGVESRDV